MSGMDAIREFLGRTLVGGPRPLVFDDRVGTWSKAQAHSSGYDQKAIVDQVTRATKAVLSGQAAFERDGITFEEPEYRWPIAYALQRASQSPAVRGGGRLRVLDIGGSLGSTYWQHRALIPPTDIAWTVVEQPAFVTAGRALCGDTIDFAESIDDLDRDEPWDIALFSSVLQYLDDPWTLLQRVQTLGVGHIVIDRTPFHNGTEDIATIQHVPAHIYPASYPAWILSHGKLRTELDDWRVLAEFPGLEPAMRTRSGVPFRWLGVIADKIDP